MKIKANGIDIEVEDTGGTGPVVVLIMVSWFWVLGCAASAIF